MAFRNEVVMVGIGAGWPMEAISACPRGSAVKHAALGTIWVLSCLALLWLLTPLMNRLDASDSPVWTSSSVIHATTTTSGEAQLACFGAEDGCIASQRDASVPAAAWLVLALLPVSVAAGGAASKLCLRQEPDGGVAGAARTDQPEVAVEDAAGSPVTTSTASIVLAITTPAGATLTRAHKLNTVDVVVATPTSCTFDTVGTHTPTATARGLTDAASSPSLTISQNRLSRWPERCSGHGSGWAGVSAASKRSWA
jgi:hypothetical protein